MVIHKITQNNTTLAKGLFYFGLSPLKTLSCTNFLDNRMFYFYFILPTIIIHFFSNKTIKEQTHNFLFDFDFTF